MVQSLLILMALGAVVVGLVGWLGQHVGRQTQRRRQVDKVRAALAGRVTVDELRTRCGADSLPLLPTPRPATGTPDPAGERGCTVCVERAS
ncbi:hypothetical protein SAMN05216188_1444 [Lentzea xinjiangensis]|uniref:Uncharacterized protein n=1 Tax=Lentzea xinjiangensis TaxID=402600 RepID=A0A1H9WUK0_9PSEU|nr:hypothetical protein [Lentzea xinjiangensis]SES37479.1 hypothetical protein SAMN05216188_1444 [Lentzea xinjiangensis]